MVCDGGQVIIFFEPQVSHLPSCTLYGVWAENEGR